VVARKATVKMLVNMMMGSQLSNKKRERRVRNEGNGFMKGAVLALLEGTIGVILTKPWVVWPQASMTISAIELLQDYLRSYRVAGHSVAVVLLR
jgi:hypothetical protein